MHSIPSTDRFSNPKINNMFVYRTDRFTALRKIPRSSKFFKQKDYVCFRNDIAHKSIDRRKFLFSL